MTEQKHTPTPWPEPVYDNDTGPNDEGFSEWWDILDVARFDKEEDARFARLACNNFDRLKTICEHLIEWADMPCNAGEVLGYLEKPIDEARDLLAEIDKGD